MLPETYAAPLYRELQKIANHASWSPTEQMAALSGLMERLFFEATKQEQIAFSSLFARISYAGHRFDFREDAIKRVHRFRLAAKWARRGHPTTIRQVHLGLRALAEATATLTGIAAPDELTGYYPDTDEANQDPMESAWLRAARVVAIADEAERNCLVIRDEAQPEQPTYMRYGLPDRNENFMPTIQVIRKVFGFPVTLNLLDVNVDAEGFYLPRAIVIEPDYLMDVSAISECFRDTGPDPYAFLLKKFIPYEVTDPQLIGNIANFFLDRLLNEPEAVWLDTFRETFQLFPFAFAPMSDAQVKDVSGKAQKHFLTIKNMAAPKGGFEKESIERENCFLEPAFFSEQYGLQGRLDLLYRTEEKAAIIELKSGTPYKPNSYGISRSHFTQTLLYDLLVRSVFGQHSDPAKFILYSGADINPLRFAPTIAPEQWEALQVRNQLVAIERLLTKIQPGDVSVPVFAKLRASGNAPGFVERDFARFETAYLQLSELEKKYFNAYTGFIAREHWLARIGEEGSDQSLGHAALWRSSLQDKLLNFNILSHLEIVENKANQAEPVIIFQKTARTHPLANFRVGDIAVLYPALDEQDTVLHHQVIKCTITALTPNRVSVQLRFRQHNLRPFETEGLWCLEPDLMDTGFAAMYRGLLEWAESPKRSAIIKPFGRVLPPQSAEEENPAQDERVFEGYKFARETTSAQKWQYLKGFARNHRISPTDAERVMWELLRDDKFMNCSFRRQHAIDNFIVDFICLKHGLIIEVDGDHSHQLDYDEARTAILQSKGYEVIRFSNELVLHQLDEVKRQLAEAIRGRIGQNPTPIPSPVGRGDAPLLSMKDNASDDTHKIIDQTHPIISSPLARDESNPGPSPVGRGGTPPLGFLDKVSEGNIDETHTTVSSPLTPNESNPSPLPTGEGPGVGLIWGPPGTGKTSVLLRDMVAHILHNTQDNLLLLAYTNRAVDEICEALDSIGGDIRNQYLRIGSKFSCAERFQEQLVSAKIAHAKNRAELKQVLEEHRIFVSTLASFGSNEGLLKLKKLHRLIVDEASQILEPQLIGLLTRFEHYTLIGDHRQLPAVTVQRTESTQIKDPELLSIGLTDLRDSYFERMYRLYQENGLEGHFTRLDRQGRMHADIMDFPNRYFYSGHLQTIAPDGPAFAQHHQIRRLDYRPGDDDFPFGHLLMRQRVVFFPTENEDNALPGQKTNKNEADLAARIVLFFKKLYAANNLPWDPVKTLGIITPWRAQIAQIRAALSESGIHPDDVTVDTVERYQGGAREIIIISTCINHENQLNSLVNLSHEGIDRKLNVALTRAREHLIMLGNSAILKRNELYAAFIAQYDATAIGRGMSGSHGINLYL